jgi:hypothetical protein
MSDQWNRNQTDRQPRQRGNLVIGTGRGTRGQQRDDPPVETEDSDDDSTSDDPTLVLSEEEIDWGNQLGGDLGFKLVGPSRPPEKPMVRARRRDPRPMVLGLMMFNPQILSTMEPRKVATTYKQLGREDRARMFDAMTRQPNMLGQVIEKNADICDELMDQVMARQDNRLVSQVLKVWGGSSSESARLVKGIIEQGGARRGSLLALALQCAGDTIDEASDPGTAGRSNTGRSAFISQLGKSGPSKDSIDQAVAGTRQSLQSLRPPPGATLEPDRLGDRSESEAGRTLQETVKLVAEMLTSVLDDLHNAPITPELSMITATMFDKANGRFGAEEARRQAGGHIFLRIIIPAIFPGLTTGVTPDQQNILKYVTKALQSVANGASFGAKEPFMSIMDPWYEKLKAGVDGFMDKVVASGRLYCAMMAGRNDLDPTDPADLLRTAQDDDALAAQLFADPDQDFPLGTRPAEATSALGRLIAQAALGRLRDYDFPAITQVRDFPNMVKAERKEVLEAIRL